MAFFKIIQVKPAGCTNKMVYPGGSMDTARLAKQIEFIIEVDKLKNIYRRSYITNGERKENDAEHSWHIALMALLLFEYSDKKVDRLKVVKMLLIHDLVEIYTGDIMVYDLEQRKKQVEKEKAAAEKLFSMLPPDQKDEYVSLWMEFEENKSEESRFARALDRLQPMLLNYATQGKTWNEAGILSSDVLKVNKIINNGSGILWHYAKNLVKNAVEKKYLPS
jgi:putative hydrolase of HD superfamily